VVIDLSGADDAGRKEIDLSSAVHLALHELEFGDLALRLAVGPWQSDRGADRRTVFDNTVISPLRPH